MSRASLAVTLAARGLGLAQTLATPPAVAGCCSSGDVNTPTKITSADQLVTTFGYGPGVDACAKLLALAGGPVVFCRVETGTAGALAGLSSGSSGTAAVSGDAGDPMTCTVTGTPRDAYDVVVTVTRAGATLEALTGAVRISLDGGETYGAETPVPSNGVIVIPDTGITLTFSDSSDTLTLDLGAEYTFTSTAPVFSTTTLAAALAALNAIPYGAALDHEFVHVVGAITATTYATVETAHDAQDSTSRYRWYLCETRDQSSGESVATWAGVLVGASPGFAGLNADRIAVVAGFCDQTSETMGTLDRRSVARLLSPRFASIPVSEHPGRRRSGVLQGIEETVYHDLASDTLAALDAAGFMGVQSVEGVDGYLATDRTTCAAGRDYQEIMRVRVICRAARASMVIAADFINESVRTTTGGVIDPRDAAAIDAEMTSRLRRELVDAGFASAVSAAVSRTTDVVSTGSLPIKVRITPLGYAKAITIDLGYQYAA